MGLLAVKPGAWSAAFLLLIGSTAQAELSGIWEQEYSHNISSGESQKFETLLDLEWNREIGDSSYLTAIGRARFDAEQDLSDSDQRPDTFSEINGSWVKSDQASLGLRELYLDTEWLGANWRLGKQQVVWGESDGLKVLDKVNPQSFREFILDDFDDSRIPTWMVNAEFPLSDDSSLQLLWIPDTSYNEMPETGADYAFTQPALVPVAPAGVTVNMAELNKPNNWLSDSELGLRYTAFISGWDLTMNYLYHHNDNAVLYQELSGSTITLRPEYERSHLLGGTLSNAFGDLTLRAEVGINSDSYFVSSDISERGIASSPEFSSVIGLDWHGFSDSMISVQWFQSHLLDYDPDIVRDQTEHTLSLLYERTFENDTWTFETLLLHSLNDSDGLIRPKLTYNASSELDIWIGADIFYGQEEGLYGQFDQQDRVSIGFSLGF